VFRDKVLKGMFESERCEITENISAYAIRCNGSDTVSLSDLQVDHLLFHSIRGPFEKLVDSPYYFESVLCEGAVTVSFRSTSLAKRCTSYNVPPTSLKRAADRLP
jgi:hypothetical protein